MTPADLIAWLQQRAANEPLDHRDRVDGPIQPWAANWPAEVLVEMDRLIERAGMPMEHAIGCALVECGGAFHRPACTSVGREQPAIVHLIGGIEVRNVGVPTPRRTSTSAITEDEVWMVSWCGTARTPRFTAVFDPTLLPPQAEGEKRCAKCFPPPDVGARRHAAALTAVATRRTRQAQRDRTRRQAQAADLVGAAQRAVMDLTVPVGLVTTSVQVSRDFDRALFSVTFLREGAYGMDQLRREVSQRLLPLLPRGMVGNLYLKVESPTGANPAIWSRTPLE